MKKLCEKRKGELATHEAELVDGTHAGNRPACV